MTKGRGSKHSARKCFPFWIIGMAIGVLFLAIGIYEKQLSEIYRKAVMICLECIGIG